MLSESPQGIGGVLDAGIRLYRAHFVALVKTGGAVFGVSFLINVLFVGGFGVDIYPEATAATTLAELYTGPMIALSLVGYAIAMLGYSAILCQLSHAATTGAALAVRQSLRAGLRRLLPVALVILLYYLVVAIGLVLLIVPGVWASISLSMATYFAADDSGPVDALRESLAIVRGHWWRTAVLLTVILLIVLVLAIALGGVSGFVAGVSAAASAGPPSTTVQFFTLAMNAIGTILLTPLAFAMGYAVYHDLQLRRSGDDLASRLDGLDA